MCVYMCVYIYIYIYVYIYIYIYMLHPHLLRTVGRRWGYRQFTNLEYILHILGVLTIILYSSILHTSCSRCT